MEAESYTLSQALIQEYIDNPIEEGHQRVPEENKKCTYTAREQALIDQFDLFVIDDNQDKEDQIIDIDQYLKRTAASCKKPSGPDLDRLLEMDEKPRKREKNTRKRIYTARELALIDQFDLFVIDDNQDKEEQNIDVDRHTKKITAASSKKPSEPDLDRLLEIDKEPSKREKDILSQEDPHFFREDTQAEKRGQKSSINDDAFCIEEKQRRTPASTAEEAPLESVAVSEEEKTETEAVRKTASQKTATISKVQEFSEKTAAAKENDINYRPIFSIEQQLNDTSSPKYPLHAKSTVPSDSVKEQITPINDEYGYTKSDVKNVAEKAQEDSPTQYYETGELLLLCGLMEDEFGQLTLIQTISAISEKEA